MPRLPLEAAQLHESMRDHQIAIHDDPWHLCPAEYRFRLEAIVQRLRDEHDELDSLEKREQYKDGYGDGYAQGRPYQKGNN